MSDAVAVETIDEGATRALAVELAGRLRPGDVIALHGPLGAGKTCFVRGLAEGLGLDPDDVSSPTFVLWHEYASEGRATLVHIDAYRVADGEELAAMGLEERLEAADAIIAIEWAERVESILPAGTVRVRLAHGVGSRRVTITRSG